MAHNVQADRCVESYQSFHIVTWQGIFDIGQPDSLFLEEPDTLNSLVACPTFVGIDCDLNIFSNRLSYSLQSAQVPFRIRAPNLHLDCSKSPLDKVTEDG